MQIVLIQAEIEKAIRNYVNSIIKVAEGVDIVIDLKSTRGDAGFTANIDLVEAGADHAPTPPSAPIPRAATPKVTPESSDDLAAAAKAKAAEAEAKKKSDMAAAAEQAALKKEQEPGRVPETAAMAKQTPADEPDEGTTEPPFEPDTKEEAPATTAEPEASEQPAAPRKPLFGRSTAALNA